LEADGAREFFLGAKDSVAPYVPDDAALLLLARFCGVSSPAALTSIDFICGVDHLEDALGR